MGKNADDCDYAPSCIHKLFIFFLSFEERVSRKFFGDAKN